MKSRFVKLRYWANFGFAIWALSSLEIGPAFAALVTDATQTSVQISEAPKRIVTLAPSLGELAADLLSQDLKRIVGVSEYSDYPLGLKAISSIGPYNKINLEKVVALKPDLVLATKDGNSKEQIAHLRDLKIPVVVVSTDNFEQVAESMKMVASALGLMSEGNQMVQKFKSGLDQIRARARSRKPVRVLLQMGQDPLIVAGGASFLDAGLSLIGAKNLYSDSKKAYPRPSLEDVIHRNPEMIVVVALGDDLKPFEKIAQSWSEIPRLKAVQDKQVLVLRSDPLIRPTLRILEGLQQLEGLVYGRKPSLQ